jgi:hypothetical protein
VSTTKCQNVVFIFARAYNLLRQACLIGALPSNRAAAHSAMLDYDFLESRFINVI